MQEQIKTISLGIIAVCLLIQVILQLTTDPATSAAAAQPMIIPPNMPSTSDVAAPPGFQDQPSISMVQPPDNPQKELKGPTGADLTSMSFSEASIDFGTMKAGEKKKHTFTVTNSGDKPLNLAGLNGDAGATILSYTTEPIPPGKAGKVEVEFDSQGLSGPQSLVIHINANANPPHVHLTMTANIQ